jgi:hypothetical protein
MAIIHNLGEGYYGIETEGAKVDPVVFERVSRAFQSASLIPEARVSFVEYKPQRNDLARVRSAFSTASSMR